MRPVELSLARHDLVWLDEARWRDAALAPLAHEWIQRLDAWFARARPAVVCRQTSGAINAINLGVALPPRQGKQKIPLLIDRAAVTRTSAPLTLAAAAVSAGARWQYWLERLANETGKFGVEFHVYGSLAWQHLSGEAYLTPGSDVDLLWRAGDATTLANTLELLTRWQQDSGLRADGELLLADGSAVAWRELNSQPTKVLVKRAAGVELRTTDDILSRLKAAPC